MCNSGGACCILRVVTNDLEELYDAIVLIGIVAYVSRRAIVLSTAASTEREAFRPPDRGACVGHFARVQTGCASPCGARPTSCPGCLLDRESRDRTCVSWILLPWWLWVEDFSLRKNMRVTRMHDGRGDASCYSSKI